MVGIRGFNRVHAGFTLIEALITLAILAILVSLAGPAMRDLILAQRVKNATYDLHAALDLARSTALTRNIDIVLAPEPAGWSAGWVIRDANGIELWRENSIASISISGPGSVTFQPNGRPSSTATPFALSAAELGTSYHRCIRLQLNGRAHTNPGVCTG
jgi:type IV fimbrial biogenesis protein FimT